MNPNTVLGVEANATPEQIKAAYRKLAMKHHPDKGGDPAEFQKIQEAYDALTKPKAQQRQQREHAGATADEHPFRRHGFAWHFANGGGDDFWGTAQRRNTDFTVQAGISLEQAYHGTQLSVTINDRIVTIAIPKGAQHGQRLSVQDEGGREHADLPPGHLHVIVVIRPHPSFQPDGSDLYTVKDVDVLDMMTGSSVDVTTMAGEKISVKIPANSKPTTRLRVSGKGMPLQGTEGFGALFIVLNPIFADLTPEQIKKLAAVKKA